MIPFFLAVALATTSSPNQGVGVRPAPAAKVSAKQSASLVCTSGLAYSAEVGWSRASGVVLNAATSNGRAFKADQLGKLGAVTAAATDLGSVQMWCSGSRDAGLTVGYVVVEGGHARRMQIDLQFQDDRILVGERRELSASSY